VPALASIGTVAAAKGPVKVHPTLRVTAARLAGPSLRFTVTVRFAPPPGASAGAACKGRVKLAEKARPNRTAPRWTAGLAPDGALCEAKVNAKLPAGLLDRKVSFEISFLGNGKVAPFAAVKKLKLSVIDAPRSGGTTGAQAPAGTGATGTEAPGDAPPGGAGSPGGGGPEGPAPEPPVIPPVSYTAADGHWQGGGLWDTGSSANVAFGVKEGVIYDINLFSSVLMRCEKKDSIPEVTLRYAHFPNAPEIPLLAPAGKFSEEFTDKVENVSFDAEIPWVVRGQLGSSSGTMVIEAHDANFDEHFSGDPEYTLSECHVSATLAVGKQ
jgi:hypothetical protein